MSKEISDYKSPPHKVIAFLKEGRDQLRVKYKLLREKHRVAENQVRSANKRRDAWRIRAEMAEAELNELKKKAQRPVNGDYSSVVLAPPTTLSELAVVGSPFDAATIAKAIRLVIDGAISLRAASRVCNIVDHCDGGLGIDAPCQTTIQNHLLRVGLFLIQRTDLKRQDWVWLFDHTINAGTTKCLIVLAISLEDFNRLTGPLAHHDLTVIGIAPVETSTGEIVCRQLEQLATRFGTPIATLSDRGSDLKKGVELFQQKHPGVRSYYDIVHLVSLVIKRILESDSKWEPYRQACCKCANFLRQISLAHLKPPTPKTKARYMNFDREVRWASRALGILQRVRSGNLSTRQRQRLPAELMEKRLGWLDEYRDRISIWMEVIYIGKAINELVRRSGYRHDTANRVGQLAGNVRYAESRLLIDEVVKEIQPMCEQLAPGESMPGSTEVLESLIGKGKRLLHHSGTSITRQILSLATATTKITTELVQEALSSCRMKHLIAWTRETLRSGVHVARREDLQASDEETKLRSIIAPATPTF